MFGITVSGKVLFHPVIFLSTFSSGNIAILSDFSTIILIDLNLKIHIRNMCNLILSLCFPVSISK